MKFRATAQLHVQLCLCWSLLHWGKAPVFGCDVLHQWCIHPRQEPATTATSRAVTPVMDQPGKSIARGQEERHSVSLARPGTGRDLPSQHLPPSWSRAPSLPLCMSVPRLQELRPSASEQLG